MNENNRPSFVTDSYVEKKKRNRPQKNIKENKSNDQVDNELKDNYSENFSSKINGTMIRLFIFGLFIISFYNGATLLHCNDVNDPSYVSYNVLAGEDSNDVARKSDKEKSFCRSYSKIGLFVAALFCLTSFVLLFKRKGIISTIALILIVLINGFFIYMSL